MTWYDPTTWGDDPASTDRNNSARDALLQNGRSGQILGLRGYQDYTTDTSAIRNALSGLRDQASGKTSYSAEALRQGLMQNQAAQRSMAAGAAPANATMAARTAAIQSARLGSALSGQQAMAGIQERNQAQQALSSALLQQRGQSLQASLGGYGLANQAYVGTLNPNADKSWAERNAPLLSALSGGVAAAL